MDKRYIRGSAAALVIVLIILAAIFGYHRPGPGDVLVSVGLFGSGKPVLVGGSGSTFRLPLYHKVFTYRVGSDSIIVDAGTAGSRDYPIAGDGLAVRGRMVVRYVLDLAGVLRLHQAVGPDYRRDELPFVTLDAFKRLLSNHTLNQIYSDGGIEFRRLLFLALEPELADVGLRLTGLTLPVLRPALGDYRKVYPDLETSGRTVILGVAGLDPGLVRVLTDRGELPNLAKTIRGGVQATVQAREPMLSPLLWTSLATGVTAERHGVVTEVAGPGSRRRAPALWDMVGMWGCRSAFVGWPGTFPAPKAPGSVMVADRLNSFLSMGRVALEEDSWSRLFEPGEMRDTIESSIVWPGDLRPETVGRFLPAAESPTDKELFDPERIKLVYAEAETYRQIALKVLEEQQPQLVGLHLDLVVKLLSMAASGDVLADEAKRDRAMLFIGGAYRYIDEVLADLLRRLGPDDVLWVVSVRGLNPDRAPSRLVGPGMMVAYGRKVVRNLTLDTVSHLDFTPTVLAGLGCPVSWSRDGQVLDRVFSSSYLADHPIAYIDSYSGRGGELDILEEGLAASLTRESPAEHIGLGRLYLEKGEYRRAEMEFRRAVELDPGNTRSLIVLGDVLLIMGRRDEAMESFQRALRINPRLADALNGLGKALLESKRPDNAIEAFKKAIEIDPGKAVVYCNLGVAYEAKGMFASAYRQYRHALEKDPNLGEAHFCLGNYYSRRGELAEAERSFKEALRINPSHVGLYINLGFIYAQQVKLDEAEEVFRRVIELAPDRWEGYLNLGRIYIDRRDFAEAERIYRDAVRRFPNLASMHNSLAEAYQLQGKLQEALNEYEQAVVLEPNNRNYQVNLQNTKTMIERRRDTRRFRP